MQLLFRLPILLLAGLAVACSQPVKPTLPEPIAVRPAPAPAPVAAGAVANPAQTSSATAEPVLDAGKEAAFIAETAASSGMAPAEIRAWLDQARYQQSIINAITRPAEGKPWKDYRPIFMTADRIDNGRRFYAEHRGELESIAAQTGVPAQYIVAIIGVETSYGRVTGTYRVLDALYTLGFFYPKREEFFRGELAHLFPLARDERLDLATLKGSYAGAMGWGQFIPSSYRNFAVDGDGDGRRDLVNSQRDAMASVANYFNKHGWQAGQPVVARAQAQPGAAPFVPADFEPRYTLEELAARGYRAAGNVPALPATLVTLEGAQGTEHWLAFKNFHVITRYNRSPLYAMAVHQLAQELAAP
jgi:membrane-bound lytic murein transglycosylase B